MAQRRQCATRWKAESRAAIPSRDMRSAARSPGVGEIRLAFARPHWGVYIHDRFVPMQTPSSTPRGQESSANEMVKEVLYLFGVHGILRKPGWRGVRIFFTTPLLVRDGERFCLLPAPLCSSSLKAVATSVTSHLTDMQSGFRTRSFCSTSDLPRPVFISLRTRDASLTAVFLFTCTLCTN